MENFPTINRLHTDVLEEKYGPIHPEVLRHDERVREAHLVDSTGCSRTYALSFFPDAMSPGVQAVDAEIRAGGSIGKTFRKHGYEIRKNVLDVYLVPLSLSISERFRLSNGGLAKARLSEFYAKRGDAVPLIYAIVLEVYHPDFRQAEVSDADKRQISAPTSYLEDEGVTREQIWESISVDDWSKTAGAVARARMRAVDAVSALKGRALAYMSGSVSD